MLTIILNGGQIERQDRWQENEPYRNRKKKRKQKITCFLLMLTTWSNFVRMILVFELNSYNSLDLM